MAYTLGTAAQATGASKSTIFRSIKSGRISATRDEQGQWQIEPAELFRVFSPLAVADGTPEPSRPIPDAMTDILVAELRATIADLRADRDHWRTAFETAQRQLPMPPERGAPGSETPNGTPGMPGTPQPVLKLVRRRVRWWGWSRRSA
jgi:hypothetical protein